MGIKNKKNSFEDEKILVEKSKSGDANAFKILIERYEGRVLKSSIWLIGNEDDAKDIASDVFLYAFQNIKKFREESSFYTWIYWILLDKVKRKRLKNKIKDSILPLFSIFNNKDDDKIEENLGDKKASSLEFLEKEEKNKRIFDIISSLEEKYKAPIILCDMDGLSYREASILLGCNETTVKTRLFRARMKLREKISNDNILKDI